LTSLKVKTDLTLLWPQGPDGYARKADLQKVGPGKYQASFLPDDCGKYKVGVKYNGEDLANSPYPVQALASGKVRREIALCWIMESAYFGTVGNRM